MVIYLLVTSIAFKYGSNSIPCDDTEITMSSLTATLALDSSTLDSFIVAAASYVLHKTAKPFLHDYTMHHLIETSAYSASFFHSPTFLALDEGNIIVAFQCKYCNISLPSDDAEVATSPFTFTLASESFIAAAASNFLHENVKLNNNTIHHLIGTSSHSGSFYYWPNFSRMSAVLQQQVALFE